MGHMEKESKKRAKRANLKKLILTTVAAAGVIGVALIAPNVLGAMDKLGMMPRKRQGEFIRGARDRLIRQRLLKVERGLLRLTPAGEKSLRNLILESLAPKGTWDGKWRVIIFDIPERRKVLREQMRGKLQAVGFAQLQRSVWIYPYDCEDLIILLKADLHIGKDLLYLIVDSLENDAAWRAHFKLRHS